MRKTTSPWDGFLLLIALLHCRHQYSVHSWVAALTLPPVRRWRPTNASPDIPGGTGIVPCPLARPSRGAVRLRAAVQHSWSGITCTNTYNPTPNPSDLISAIQQAVGHCSVFRGIPHKWGERRPLLETIFPTDCATTLSTPVQCPFLGSGFDTSSSEEMTAHQCLLRHPRWDRYGWRLLNHISWPFSQHLRWVTLGYCSHFALIRSKMAELVGLAIPSKLKFTCKLLTQETKD